MSWVETCRQHARAAGLSDEAWQVLRAFAYNPAGAFVFYMAVGGGVLGLVRLITRRHRLLRWPWALTAVVWSGWFGLLYAGHWALRAWGVNPLP